MVALQAKVQVCKELNRDCDDLTNQYKSIYIGLEYDLISTRCAFICNAINSQDNLI